VSRVVVTGATGLIGQAVVRALADRGDEVVALSRDAGRAAQVLGEGVETVAWADPTAAPPSREALSGADAVVNLLGEQLAQRWSPEVKARIRDSRVLGTRNLVAGIRQLVPAVRPKVLVSQSASGYYGPRDDEPLDESSPPGADFLGALVQDWEAEALAAASEDGLRVVVTRTGVVLAPKGGALGKMLPFFRLGIGGPVGSGRQYLPWIHIDDVVGALLYCLDDPRANGPVNLAAPAPVDNRTFSHALGRALHRPAFLPVPAPALKLLYGEMSVIVLTGQRLVPGKLGGLGYEFRHPEVEEALRDVLAS
jgi:uncharacterized protein (TIGR01777 family)